MRKLLLTSSALVAAASISSYAVADVSVTGGFEWKYTQQLLIKLLKMVMQLWVLIMKLLFHFQTKLTVV